MSNIWNLPNEVHDLIKSFLSFPDQIRFFYCRKDKLGSRLVEGREQVEDAFHKAIRNNKASVAKHLLKCYPNLDPSNHDNIAILGASLNGHVEVVKVLLADERVDPSADYSSAFRFACKNGHVEVVKILLADGRVDPSAKNNFAAKWASCKGHAEVVKILLADERIDPSQWSFEAIRLASENGHAEVFNIIKLDPRVLYDGYYFI